MISEHLIKAGKDPLHEREFLAHDPASPFQAIGLWMKYIEVFFIKILDVEMCLCLPPNMIAYQVSIKNMKVHDQAQKKSS